MHNKHSATFNGITITPNNRDEGQLLCPYRNKLHQEKKRTEGIIRRKEDPDTQATSTFNSQNHKDPLVIKIVRLWVIALLTHNISCKFFHSLGLHNQSTDTLLSMQVPLPQDVLPQLECLPIIVGCPDRPIS